MARSRFSAELTKQIKIRGFRIEPAEIVRVLNEHPAVQTSTLIDREVEPGDKRLVAYFVPAAKAQPTHAEFAQISSRVACRITWFQPYCEARSPASESKRQRWIAPHSPAPNADNTLRDGTFVAGHEHPLKNAWQRCWHRCSTWTGSAPKTTFFSSAATLCSARN